MVRSVQEIASKGWSTWAMDVCCPKCAHCLWAQKVYETESYYVWAFFYRENHSAPYSKRVWLCPECGAWLTEGGGWPTSGVPEGHQKSNVDL